MFVPACWRSTAVALLLVVTAACAAPPDKEIAFAQGAIEAARAAGAADFATAELAGAEETLARAHADVGARDYRAALGHALDATTRAQGAARAAAEGRVTARLAAERALDDFARLIERVDTALAAAEAKRVPAATTRSTRTTVDDALALLAALRATVERGERTSLDAIAPAARALETALAALTAPPAKRTRPARQAAAGQIPPSPGRHDVAAIATDAPGSVPRARSGRPGRVEEDLGPASQADAVGTPRDPLRAAR